MMSNGSSIDPHRLALEASSAEWFKWVTWYGYAVAFGCAMEVWEVSVTIKNWWLFRFRNVEAEENKKSWASPIAAIGLLIIVVGIVLETYREGKSASAETELRNYFSEKLTAAEQASADAVRDAGAAKESASAAGASALVAKGAADKAVTASSSALSNVQTLGVRTAALDKGLLMRGDRSSLLEKREVTFRIANALGPQNGDSVLIWYNSDKPKSDGLTDETYLTAYEVQVIFQIGKWWNTPIATGGRSREKLCA